MLNKGASFRYTMMQRSARCAKEWSSYSQTLTWTISSTVERKRIFKLALHFQLRPSFVILAEINPDQVFAEQYGASADANKGPAVFHPPLLQKAWMARYSSVDLLERLEMWELGGDPMTIAFERKGPEVNPSRADWERGEERPPWHEATVPILILARSYPEDSSLLL